MLSFSPGADYAVGSQPASIVSGDFNADGRPDLATANLASNDVSVVLANTDGTFQAAQASPTGVNPRSMAVGDFNSDGKLDLVTSNAAGLSLLLGNGNGTFQAASNVGSELVPSSVAVGDFNADGKLDLGVTSNVYFPGGWGYYGQYPGYFVGTSNVLLGNGAGAFAAPLGFSNAGFQGAATLADFNADGKLDFAAASYEYGYIVLQLGDGTGNLQTPGSFTTAYIHAMTAGDLNGDGKPDLVTSNPYDQVGVLLNDGLGGFSAAQLYAAGNNPTSIAIGDFNNDGKVDLITSNAGDGAAGVLLGDGTGSFAPPFVFPVGSAPAGVVARDFNDDGRLDAATGNAGSNNLTVLLNDGNWPPLSAPLITFGSTEVAEGNVGTSNAVVTVSLSAAFASPVTVQYATHDGTATLAGGDYQATSGTLTFAPGQTSRTILIPINGDRIAESNESLSVHLSNPTNAFVSTLSNLAIIIDDEPYLTPGDEVIGLEGNTGKTPFTFTVTLSAVYDAPVTVDYSTSDLTEDWLWYYGGVSAIAGEDYVSASGTLIFAAGETSKTLTVEVIGDRLGEWDQYFLVQLSNPTSATLYQREILARIVDDEPYASIYNNDPILEGNAGTKTTTFSVTLTTAYDVPVTVSYSTIDGSALAGTDYVATTSTVTFAPGQTSLPISVTVLGDAAMEQEEYFLVQLNSATNGVIGNYNLAYGTIVDDDTSPSLTVSDVSKKEGNSGNTKFVFTVTLSSASSTRVTVDYATANGTAKKNDNDYVASSGKLTFRPGETTKTVTVTVKGDKKSETHETFFLNLGKAKGALIDDGQGLGTILNDDAVRQANAWYTLAWAAFDDLIDNLFGSGKKR